MEDELPTKSYSAPALPEYSLPPGTDKHSSKWDQLPIVENLGNLSRKEKRKTLKKLKRKAIRKEVAEKERAEEEVRLNDPAAQLELQLQEQAEAETLEKARKQFEEQERIWLENHTKATEEARRKQQEELQRQQAEQAAQKEEEENWEYVEEGPAEIIWQGNEIIVQKKRIRVPKKNSDEKTIVEDSDQPISNPLPPQHAAFADYQKVTSSTTGLKVSDGIEQQIPNFGTEQDKAHCPFHIKTGACRFGARCSRAHFYPDKSCTLLMKSMYNGPGLTWEQDEGLEYTDEEVALHYDEFYEDVHTEFLKFGELVNFKVCRNASAHLRGNVYVHYQSLDSAIAAYNAINGRFFAGKQITCEFIGVTRWKVAICGEYMKSRHKTCSHGSACNFLHCFRNPGGEYEWADWDNPPPRSWLIKMDMLFGGSRIAQYDNRKLREHDNWNSHGYSNRSSSRRSSRQHKLRERDSWSSDDSGTKHKEYTGRKYSGEEERETRSDSDQSSDVYNRKENKRCSHNRGASDKTKRGENEISKEDKEITDRYHRKTDRNHRKTDRSMHGTNRKRHHREHSCEDDTDDKKRRADNVDSDFVGKKHSESRRGSCIRLDDDHNIVKYKSKDRLTSERENDLQSSRSEKEQWSRESRRSQDHVKESMDQEKMKSSRRGHHSSKSPRKHREHERVQRRHGESRRVKNYNQLQRRDQSESMSPEKDQRKSKLSKRSRDFSRTPKSSEEDSLDGVDRWQASDYSVF